MASKGIDKMKLDIFFLNRSLSMAMMALKQHKSIGLFSTSSSKMQHNNNILFSKLIIKATGILQSIVLTASSIFVSDHFELNYETWFCDREESL